MPTRTNDPGVPDAALVESMARGEERALEELFLRYREPVYAFVLRLVRDASQAEELVNDTFVEAWRSSGTFRGEARASTWLFGIARFKALSALRRRNPEVVAIDEADEFPDPEALPDELVLRRELRAEIAAAIDTLSAAHREVVELALVEGLSLAEIALIVGRPEGTVKTRLFHARIALRRILRKPTARGKGMTP